MSALSGEAMYDKHIAPKLMAIANECKALGLPFLAVVEYAPHCRAETRQLKNAGLAMHLIRLAIEHGENLDGYALGVTRYCKENGVDTSRSVAAQLLAGRAPLSGNVGLGNGVRWPVYESPGVDVDAVHKGR